MKISLPLKLGIGVVLLFATVIAACLLWGPVIIRYHMSKFHSSNPKDRVKSVDALLAMGERGVDALAKEFRGSREEAEFLAKYWGKYNDLVGKVWTSKEVWYPLEYAARNNYLDATRLLIDRGADVNCCIIISNGIPTRDPFMSDTPLDAATNKKIKKLLRLHGAKTSEEIRIENGWAKKTKKKE